MKATELIEVLNSLVEEHGDLIVVSSCNYDIIEYACYEKNSWVNGDNEAIEIG